MKKGTRVKKVYGDRVTVLFIREHLVMPYENDFYHKNKLLLETGYRTSESGNGKTEQVNDKVTEALE